MTKFEGSGEDLRRTWGGSGEGSRGELSEYLGRVPLDRCKPDDTVVPDRGLSWPTVIMELTTMRTNWFHNVLKHYPYVDEDVRSTNHQSLVARLWLFSPLPKANAVSEEIF